MTPDERALHARVDAAYRQRVLSAAKGLASICRVTTDGGKTWRNWPEGTLGTLAEAYTQLETELDARNVTEGSV